MNTQELIKKFQPYLDKLPHNQREYFARQCAIFENEPKILRGVVADFIKEILFETFTQSAVTNQTPETQNPDISETIMSKQQYNDISGLIKIGKTLT